VKKILKYVLLPLVVFVGIFLIYFADAVILEEPVPADQSILELNRTEHSSSFFTLKNNWFRRSNSGLFELYVEGDGFERGVANGKLAKELVVKQEVHFIDQIEKMVPSRSYLNFLKYLVAWFNKDLDKFITEEYKEEIFGVSRSAGDEYDFVGPKYMRILNYHAAHDIGHALQDRHFTVGCTSFAAWDSKSTDSTLIIGRNFDFYSGDEFAEDKIVQFINPTKGNKFMFITWGGFVGAVSGMNNKGLTVTINASKSDYPTSSATPISLVAREILQYASTIDEAYAIAEKRTTFVSESILIGSTKDGKAAIIEKSPSKMGLHQANQDYIVCSNNYQSEAFKNDSMNIKNIEESSSFYRYERMQELISGNNVIGKSEAASIMRDRYGKDDAVLGNGNEKAINQLIAHHSVIFKPELGLAWVSTAPYQIGEYICYDINKVFNDYVGLKEDKEIAIDSLSIAVDDFVFSDEFRNYQVFRRLRKKINSDNFKLTPEIEGEFIMSNANYYLTYYTLADYYYEKEDYNAAKTFYIMAADKILPTKQEEQYIKDRIVKCKAELK
jgi:isopenicillin-N N-acyltransferase-like protein